MGTALTIIRKMRRQPPRKFARHNRVANCPSAIKRYNRDFRSSYIAFKICAGPLPMDTGRKDWAHHEQKLSLGCIDSQALDNCSSSQMSRYNADHEFCSDKDKHRKDFATFPLQNLKRRTGTQELCMYFQANQIVRRVTNPRIRVAKRGGFEIENTLPQLGCRRRSVQ